MTSSHAIIATEHASRYLQQLCKHWAHKLTVTFTPEQGQVDFDAGTRLILTATPQELKSTLSAETSEQLERMQDVVANHLQRFAHKEELVFNWQSAA